MTRNRRAWEPRITVAAGEFRATQQLDQWARLGRELEASPAVTHDSIASVLAGQAPYDALGDREQAIVRVAWDQQITERIGGLDFEDRLRTGGRPWAEADADGN